MPVCNILKPKIGENSDIRFLFTIFYACFLKVEVQVQRDINTPTFDINFLQMGKAINLGPEQQISI